jgi:hypothetical protein
MELPYKDGLSGYFEFPTENARRLIPGHLEPFELHHGSSIFSMSVFDMPSSPVGPYRQVVMAVVVVPYVKGDAAERMPKVAVYPYLVGTSAAMPRQIGSSMFHLPHWTDDLKIDLERSGKNVTAKVAAGSDPVAEMTVSEYEWEPADYVYQTFMKDATGAYRANILVKGEISEHEEETGQLVLHDHPFNSGLMIADVYDVPFREVWTRNAVQTFEPLVQIQPA